METKRPKRSLRSMRLTRKYHVRYQGMWVLITVCLLVALNVAIFMLLEQRWQDTDRAADGVVQVDSSVRARFVIAMVLETILDAAASAFLAMLTAHRIAGPYSRLRQTFDKVRNGDVNIDLRFRS